MNKIILLVSITIFNLTANDFGSLLFHGNCTTCHFETKALSAPSIIEIQEKYRTAFASKKDFVNYMSTWVLHPNKEGSLMLDAIKKYELMPELGYDLESLKTIAEYIYETDFTQAHSGHKE